MNLKDLIKEIKFWLVILSILIAGLSISCIFTAIGVISAFFSKKIGFIILFLDLVGQVIYIVEVRNIDKDNKAEKLFLERPIVACIKIIILSIIVYSLFTSWASVWWWEHSRGGAKFHFEDFKTSEQLQKYFEEHYPVGSDGRNLTYDAETAGAKCDIYDKHSRFRYKKSQIYKSYPVSSTYAIDISIDRENDNKITIVKIDSYIYREHWFVT